MHLFPFFFQYPDRILERFHDTEEKVRLQAVISVCEAAAERIDSVPEKVRLKTEFNKNLCDIAFYQNFLFSLLIFVRRHGRVI